MTNQEIIERAHGHFAAGDIPPVCDTALIDAALPSR